MMRGLLQYHGVLSAIENDNRITHDSNIKLLCFPYPSDTRQYTIMPQLCTAYKGTYRNENDKKMNLWSYNK